MINVLYACVFNMTIFKTGGPGEKKDQKDSDAEK